MMNSYKNDNLKNANNLYRSGDYVGALKLYKSFASKFPSMERFISLNIELCRKNINPEFDYENFLLFNEDARFNEVFDIESAFQYYQSSEHIKWTLNDFPDYKLNDYIVTLLGYKENIGKAKHTNWYPWNRFFDVFKTLGQKVEWVSIDELTRGDEKRLFITWNEPTSLELAQSNLLRDYDIIFQKLTSLGKGMDQTNWTDDPKSWNENWDWPIYQTVEYLFDLGVNIYGFGCLTETNSFKEKSRISKRLKDRIFWISWGGTPFNWHEILHSKFIPPELRSRESVFVGSKWGSIGRGNLDSWERYITPIQNCLELNFKSYGGIGRPHLSDDEMKKVLGNAMLCPILHAPSWQAERGVQDRFFSVFLSGSFGISDNLGVVDLFGDAVAPICTEDPDHYFVLSKYYFDNPEKQKEYAERILVDIKKKYNFYVQWLNILLNIDLKNSRNLDACTSSNIPYIHKFTPRADFNYTYVGSCDLNTYFDKIFVVNLPSDTEKRFESIINLHKIGLTNFEIIDGVNGIEVWDSMIDKDRLITPFERIHKRKHISNYGELGCARAHQSVMEIAISRGYNKILILEDDFIPIDTYEIEMAKAMESLPEDWDLAYFGASQAHWREVDLFSVNNCWYRASFTCGTFAYAIHSRIFKQYENVLKSDLYPADSALVHEIQPFCNAYAMYKPLFIADLSRSSIKNAIAIENLESKLKWPIDLYKSAFKFDGAFGSLNSFDSKALDFFCRDSISRTFFDLSNLLYNKKVAIVGPAPSVKNERDGVYIDDEFDFVVRINKQTSVNPELIPYVGSRTDILFNCMNDSQECGGILTAEQLLECGVRFVVSSIPFVYNNTALRDKSLFGNFKNLHFITKYFLRTKCMIPTSFIDDKFYFEQDLYANTRVNTGLMAILYLASLPVSSIYIKGFTFFIDGYLMQYRSSINGVHAESEEMSKSLVADFMKTHQNHAQEPQWRLLKNLYLSSGGRIKVDNTLHNILNLEEFPHDGL